MTPIPKKLPIGMRDAEIVFTIADIIDVLHELTSRIDTIAGNQLEMKRGKRCPEEDFGFEPKDQPKRWRAEDSDNDGYWYINDWGDSMYAADNRDDRHNFRYNTGNYHPTREAAEAYKAKLLSDNAQ